MRRIPTILTSWLLVLVAAHAPSCAAGEAGALSPAAQTAVLIGAGAGVLHVDLPDPDRPGKSFGSKLDVGFVLGYRLRPWLEVGAEVGFGMLGQSDSLNAVIAARSLNGLAHFTLVHFAASVRPRWIVGSGRWAPYLRAGAGGVTSSLSGPAGLGRREDDLAWNVGGGVEFYAHPRLVLRAEGLDLVQQTNDGARHHAAAGLALLYALTRSALDVPGSR